MTGKNKVIRIFESFVLGFCKCDCKTEINIRTSSHYLKQFAHGHNRPNFGKHLGKNKNGKWLVNGYWVVYVPDHPYATTSGCVFEHRLRMEEYLDRYLLPTEEVHHLDLNKENNRIGNLMYFANHREHMQYEKPITMFNRVCLLCGSDKTRKDKTKAGRIRSHWYGNEKDGFVCYNCNLKMKRKSRKKLGGGYNPYV